MRRALAPHGVIATQGECLWLHLPLITTVLRACAEMFGSVDYAFTTVPSYPSGQIGFVLASVEERGEFGMGLSCDLFRLDLVSCIQQRDSEMLNAVS